VPAQKALCSPDGTRVAAVGAEAVDVYDVASGAKVGSPSARAAGSPRPRLQLTHGFAGKTTDASPL
jgi:hypothetical protein